MTGKTQAEIAYDELSHRLLTQEILPGDRIKEQTWASKLSVSRSAIREGLTRLLGEGVVRAGERGGFFASELTDLEIREIREVREIIETAAFGLACERITRELLKQIEETCDDYANFLKKNYLSSAHEADLRFHQLLVSASGNGRLQQLYVRSHIPLFMRKMSRNRVKIEDFVQTEKEHRQIFEALRKKNAKLGVALLHGHFKRGETEALEKSDE
jgi:DNA-binding GntR family transcriptional regulator